MEEVVVVEVKSSFTLNFKRQKMMNELICAYHRYLKSGTHKKIIIRYN